MRNGLPVAALSEFVNEVRESPEEAVMDYGINITWESGTRGHVEAKPMCIGGHMVSRKFSWKADEPRQLMGTNHGANPQELLLSGLGACMMVSFLAGASAKGIQIETLELDFDASLDLRGFLGIDANTAVGFPNIGYTLRVTGNASAEEFDALHLASVAHSPNAQTMLNQVQLAGTVVSSSI